MKNRIGKRISGCVVLIVMLVCSLCITAFAETLPCESAAATAHYRHPQSGKIEDSGGESGEALGQGMVETVVDKQALVERNSDGSYNLSLRFHLMNNLSKIQFSVQKAGETTWQSVPYEKTASGEDTGDLRLKIPAKDAVVKAVCMVDAMGREVTFFVTLDQFTPGNSGGFLQSEQGADPTPQQEQSGKHPVLDDTVGLVVGGNQEGSVKPQSETHPIKEVAITTDVWIMFFCLVFCAQLLACLAFWGIKTLICNAIVRKRHRVVTDKAVEEPEEDPDFSDDFWNENWEESEDEQK